MNQELFIKIRYPTQGGRIVLRTDQDWDKNIEADTVSADETTFEFKLNVDRHFLYFKPCLVQEGDVHWARGENYLAITEEPEREEVFPHFFTDPSGHGRISAPIDMVAKSTSSKHRIRVHCPPGYSENTLKRYPVLYMHDGQNLFFPDEAFAGQTWGIEKTLSLLDAMCLIEELIVVAIYPNDRTAEYTAPGYEAYGQFLVEDLKSKIDSTYRTKPGREHTAVMGSSLGGVVSMYLAWQWPEVFGMAACMSSTFAWSDDLLERVRTEEKRDIKVYIDSGWPRDNYEVGRAMRDALYARGHRQGRDLLYFAFPEAIHNERFWAARFHIPIEFFFGELPQIVGGEPESALPTSSARVAARRR